MLTLLHDRTLSLTGSGQLQDVMLFLTQAAAVPYMDMLAKWLYRGIIKDPYQEVKYFIAIFNLVAFTIPPSIFFTGKLY